MPDEEPPEPDRVERTDVGASIEVKFKRGTGTRDQDAWQVKGKGSNAEEALENFEESLDSVEEEFVQRVREIQPEIVEEEDGEDDG